MYKFPMIHGALERTPSDRLADNTWMRILSLEASADLPGGPDHLKPGGWFLCWEAIMKLDVNPEEVDLLRILLEKDLGETRVEVHHAKNIDYKAHLQAREKTLQTLADRLKASN